MNLHRDHPASCLCCVYLEFNEESPDYSEYTPGESSSICCKKNIFDTMYSPDGEDMHELQTIGLNCDVFEARD